MLTRIMGSSLALLSFAVVCFSGLIQGHSFASVITGSLVALVVGAGVGVLAAVAVVSQSFLLTALLPVVILMLLTLVPAMVVWFRVRRCSAQMPEQRNPTQLKSAVSFGAMYAAVLLALALAKTYWNGRGLYVVACLSGLTEVDAITLSTARMSQTGQLAADVGWRLIVVAAMANLVSKASIAGLLGGWRLLGQIALLFAIPMLGGAALLTLL